MRKKAFLSLVRTEISLFPFLKDIKKYTFKYLRKDFFSALSVALLAIPQSIAYSLLAGLPPAAGLFSAIFGAIFTGAFGSCRHLVSGPSTGVAILLQTTIADTLFHYYGHVTGAEKDALVMTILTHIVLIMGIFQLLAGIFNFGKLLQFVSRSVILGYFAGVLIAIVVSQLFYFFGIEVLEGAYPVIYKAYYLILHLGHINISVLGVGIVSIVLLWFLHKKLKKWPNALIMLVVAGVFSYFLNKWLDPGAFFLKNNIPLHVKNLGDIGFSEMPKLHFIFPFFQWTLIHKLFFPAIALSVLSILEVFSVSRTMIAKSGQEVSSNQETFAVGISNFFLSFLYGAMPASGSISRSILNLKNKAKTRFSSVFSGIIVAILVLFCWPLVKHIPLAGLAALLLFMMPSMVDPTQVKLSFKATKGDFLVFLLTMASCLFFSLNIAFFIGIILSIAFYLKKAAVPHLVEYAFNAAGRLMVVSTKKRIHRKVRIIGISGELFFGCVDLFQTALHTVTKDPHVQVIILRLNGVYYMDASMCFAILRLHEYLKSSKRHLVISGITKEVLKVFNRSCISKQIGSDSIFLSDETKPQLSTWRACIRANELLK